MTEQTTINLNSYYYTKNDIDNILENYISKTKNDQGFLKSNGNIIDPAYAHPNSTNLGGAKSSKLYKIAVDAQGHVKTVDTNIQATDLPSNIPASQISGLPTNISSFTNDSHYIAKNDTDDILLANGDTKPQSDFATSGHDHQLSDLTDYESLSAWTLARAGSYTWLWYNKDLELCYIRMSATKSFSDTNWFTYLYGSDYPNSLGKYRPALTIGLPSITIGNDDTRIQAYMKTNGDIMLRSSQPNSHEFLISGMYPLKAKDVQ